MKQATSASPIVIIGAGLSGLAAALELEAAGESCLLVDQGSHVGGKLETSVLEDSYLLDRGFQVLLPSYPELQRFENLKNDLDLQYFASGARLELAEGALMMGDPLQEPRHFFSTAFGPYANFKDKLLVLKLKFDTSHGPSEALLRRDSRTTMQFLKDYGFSSQIIQNFWQPFFSGIFLETQLKTSSGFFLYLVRMFGSSAVAAPRKGIGELPKLLAKRLKRSEIRLNTRIQNITPGRLKLENSAPIDYRALITTTKGEPSSGAKTAFGEVTSFWFAAPEPPFSGPWLSLCPSSRTFINHVAVLSNVSRDYAARGDALICVNTIGPAREQNPEKIKTEAERIYGSTARDWRLLRIDRIDQAFALYLDRTDQETPSQQGALQKGRVAAQKVLNSL